MFEVSMQGISIGPVEIRFYAVMILTGLLAGIVLAQREARRLGENPEHVVNIAALGALFGIIGARLYHVIHQWEFYLNNPARIFAIWTGGLGIFGAIAGAALALVIYVWWYNRQALRRRGSPMRVLRWFDIGAPAFLLGQAIGRWGNYFNQELFGPPTDLPWGIYIPLENRLAEAPQYAAETHFHPLFLYESLLSLLGVIALLWVARRFQHRLRTGDILLGYFVWYSGSRFLYEFLRIDPWTIGPLPMAQALSIVLVLGAIGVLVWRHRQPAPPTEDEGQQVSHSRSRAAERRRRRRGEAGLHG